MIPIRAFSAEKLALASRREGMQIMVFLAGPFIEIDNPPRSLARNKASILRYALYKHIEQSDYDVSLGEYRELLDSYAAALGAQHNAALAEIGHAKDAVDAIVLLPSSPGSFSELGAFASQKKICEKMLIIIDKKYESDINYVNLGPSVLAKNLGSEVIYIDYSDHNACIAAVDDFIGHIKSKKLRDEILKS
jgi:hypothetical protein